MISALCARAQVLEVSENNAARQAARAVQADRSNDASTGATVNGISWVSTDPLLSVGIGTSTSDRKEAFTIYKDGRSA